MLLYLLVEVEYNNLCEELRLACVNIKVTKNIHQIMPLIIKFEKSGFPDNNGVQKAALTTIADIIDEQFKTVRISEIIFLFLRLYLCRIWYNIVSNIYGLTLEILVHGYNLIHQDYIYYCFLPHFILFSSRNIFNIFSVYEQSPVCKGGHAARYC